MEKLSYVSFAPARPVEVHVYPVTRRFPVRFHIRKDHVGKRTAIEVRQCLPAPRMGVPAAGLPMRLS